jgi:hypothetical protein
MGGPKGIRVGDIDSRYVIDNEAQIEKWEEQLSAAQHECDTLDVFYEALKQKSFSIREFASIDEDERFNNSSSMGIQQDRKETSKIDKIRQMMQRRQST